VDIRKIWTRRKSRKSANLTATSDDFSQEIILETRLLDHVSQYRQTAPFAKEAGGQIFGKVEQRLVRLMIATGPYPGDERGRYHYRSNPDTAQEAIENNYREGLLYLGEWHTHAEDKPRPSRSDDKAMDHLFQKSQRNTDVLVMLIVGRDPEPDGLCIVTVSANCKSEWKVS
jgi:integrative and conjugative element protein (TIGR02256 family)